MASNNRPLSDKELQNEIQRIMNGDFQNDSYLESGDEIDNEWEEEDRLEVESKSTDSNISDFGEEVNNERDNVNGTNLVIANQPLDNPIYGESSTSSEENIPLSIIAASLKRKRNIIKPKSIRLKGKNGYKWSTKLPQLSKRTARRNIVHFISGSKVGGEVCSEIVDYFLLFFSEDILNRIVVHTNEEIAKQAEKYTSNTPTISILSKMELLALFGILVMTAVKKDNHLNAKQMFDSTISGSFYKGCMSCERFIFLVNCLRFDSKKTRTERLKNDAFAHIREIWNTFIETCRTSYTPSSYLTIDEQLLGFRGRCPFRMYIPNKPSKYGIKIVMLCDSSSKYMIDASPYLGKSTHTGGLPLSNYYIKELTKSVHGTHRNITMDNWFTSVGIADELLSDPYKLTIIGTIRKNKKEIPPEMLELAKRKPQSSMFCFDKSKTLLSYMSKKNKLVLLLSTMHEGAEISEINNKPIIILNYNETKSGVDTFDQMCSNMSCSRKTRRWPLCIFYGMVNTTCVNSYVLYCCNNLKNGEKPLRRYQFMIHLAHQLARPWMEHRLSGTTLRRKLRQTIQEILKIEKRFDNATQVEGKRTLCYYCPSRLRRMTTIYCTHCKHAMCGEHRGKSCTECLQD
ncbi:piggyBac transposable element-derived protein 4-like [Euwallacea fornicatus]|uniref:piggyBac transposable element-derived protein 4-like n=1 Tax=Euwallacea fornicatus TaxID=995702 RepID=UPI00338DE241